MLDQFLLSHRDLLIERCKARVVQRSVTGAPKPDLLYGIPVFLDQLIKTLQIERLSHQARLESRQGDGASNASELGLAATLHGMELLDNGYTVEQVVRDYGDLCQSITDLAVEMDAVIENEEFKTLNCCLDNGIAEAVTEFSRRRERAIRDTGTQAFNEQLGQLAHELRNHISTATLAVAAIRTGNVGLTGATAKILDRSLISLKNLIDRSLADVRVTAGLPERHQLLSVAEILEEARFSASFEARARGCELLSVSIDNGVTVDADEEMLLAAIGNLLQNGFKFTAPGTAVTLSAETLGDRVLIHVQDHCGGLPPGITETMFVPFSQHGKDKSGMGLGLSICQRSVEANMGSLSVRDLPGTGCIFTINLPRHAIAS
jgi:signal transduction histidine kinase